MATSSDSRNVQRVGFLLVRNFALMSYAAATEPLRAANLLAARPLYQVFPLAQGGGTVTSSSGVSIDCADLESDGETCHTLFVCAGGEPADWADTSAAHTALRRLSRLGIRIGGISSGAFVLAAAGLLDNNDFTIHWEHAPALKEAFPHLNPRHARFVLDGAIATCGGGVAPLDMMHAMIAERLGTDFARRVSDWYLHAAVAEPTAPQRGSVAERFGTNHPALLAVLEKMETAIERPLGRTAMARLAGVSPRHLDRLFKEHRGAGFLDTYREIRLRHARRLLQQSPLSIAEIAYATGFSSPAHFSNAFKDLFSETPGSLRRRRGA
ncbi:GlxA family transcriptional regulator [Sinorhizobium medicae]|uniref:GlxA family transcriptional regulator n=1 Tax=Sinorhizobium medicae TaxID=110321 RepID=UPI000418C54C|nr:GlxA family transcriptional regulator [Sinorhizobium medicae]MQX50790.1 helix-turn-helix domain-containing protein [Sinorhizobium medicae]RVQ61804.1 GlxA family transcriptional regulator [Sinorhizobium medicae]WQO45544.1 GlxA family transcriptional regulator [Sinorhizobium medicae]WQO65708.1 GlxA family transcriptional regulator [Sinorhizobium medicae]WQO72838.1 GlxA family transcriptional regulator [Sinorhizobium medicae]